MALGDSIVGICNIALTALGETPITALTDPVKRAILCSARYDDVRRAVLRGHPWNCARKVANITSADPAPVAGYSFAYPLPQDFMRMVEFTDDPIAAWDVVGDKLYADDGPPLAITYIFDLQDPSKFDPLLVQAIGYSLAVELAQPLTQSPTKQQAAMTMLQEKMGMARTVGSQENSVKPWDVDIWLRSRW